MHEVTFNVLLETEDRTFFSKTRPFVGETQPCGTRLLIGSRAVPTAGRNLTSQLWVGTGQGWKIPRDLMVFEPTSLRSAFWSTNCYATGTCFGLESCSKSLFQRRWHRRATENVVSTVTRFELIQKVVTERWYTSSCFCCFTMTRFEQLHRMRKVSHLCWHTTHFVRFI